MELPDTSNRPLFRVPRTVHHKISGVKKRRMALSRSCMRGSNPDLECVEVGLLYTADTGKALVINNKKPAEAGVVMRIMVIGGLQLGRTSADKRVQWPLCLLHCTPAPPHNDAL